jgi:hypothetical protein
MSRRQAAQSGPHPGLAAVRRRLQPSDIAVFERPGVLPDGKAGQVLTIEAQGNAALGTVVSRVHDMVCMAAAGSGMLGNEIA